MDATKYQYRPYADVVCQLGCRVQATSVLNKRNWVAKSEELVKKQSEMLWRADVNVQVSENF